MTPDERAREMARHLVEEWISERWTVVDEFADAITTALLTFREEEKWQPIETAPKDGRRVLLWVCTRGSLRRGWPEICWWGTHPDWGAIWLRHGGREVVGPGVATHWKALDAPSLPLSVPPPAEVVGSGEEKS